MKKRIKKPIIGSFARRKTVKLNQVKSIFLYGKVETSLPKAKELTRLVDVLISRAKGNKLTALRLLEAKVGEFKLAKKIYQYAQAALVKRNSGFTCLSKIDFRRGDNSPRARVELIDFIKPVPKKKVKPIKEKK